MENNHNTHFYRMDNVIQNYAWGSRDSLNQLFGIDNPNSQPQAEIWMGAHPNGCSQVETAGQSIKLSDLIAEDKAAFLSAPTAETFGELPYLFKVLAAAQALSIQVHPSKSEAEAGFAKENKAGIPLSAAHRNYRDPNHKPELVYALTPYQAMNGFRSLAEIVSAFSSLALPVLSDLVSQFKAQQSEQGLEFFFTHLLSLSGAEKAQAVDGLLSYAETHKENAIFALILELSWQYPGDIGLFAPLMLNVLTLQPGEAMYLDARTPHAYLKGTGLEIMANSDNVLRAGLTPKHMDIDELAKCTRFAEKPAETLLLKPVQEGEALLFPVPVPDFCFAIYPSPDQASVAVSSAEIILPIDAEATLVSDDGQAITVQKGQSVFIPAYVKQYRVTSSGRVARAYN